MSVPNFSFVPCLEVARLVRLASRWSVQLVCSALVNFCNLPFLVIWAGFDKRIEKPCLEVI